ncbi:MAG: hypothetical protein M1831_001398 [Alyxoria varia]|nr:MAG: hypothetical protein M1831_001398 [Alyxoria varia]
MPWTPLPRLAFAICVYPFTPSSPADLPLQIGDELYIIETNGRWYRGYLVAPPSLLAGLTSTKGQTLEKRVFTGIFPRDCVEIRELLGDVTRHGAATDSAENNHGTVQDHALTGTATGEKPPVTKSAQTEPGRENALGQSVEQYCAEDNKSDNGKLVKPLAEGSAATDQDELQEGRNGAVEGEESPSPEATIRKPSAPVPMLKIGDESALARQEPLVDEIASCLREWHSSKLHDLLLGRKYGKIDQMASLVTRLDYARRQLLHQILTRKELQEVREAAVWDLVRGNKLLSGEIVVRGTEVKGRILTCDDSAIEMSQLQVSMSLSNERPVAQVERSMLHHALVELKNISVDISTPSNIILCLYRKVGGEALEMVSETYSVDVISRSGNSVVFDNPSKTLFADIIGSDLYDPAKDRSSIYLVAKVMTSEPPVQPRSSNTDIPGTSDGWSSQSPINANGGNWRNTSTKGSSRRSLMWAHKGSKDSESNLQNVGGYRGETPPSNQTPGSDPRPTTSASEEKIYQKPVKRITGFGVVEISNYLKDTLDSDLELNICTPQAALADSVDKVDDWDELASRAFGRSVTRQGALRSSSYITLHLRAFKNPSSDALVQATPTLLYNITPTPRVGFLDAPSKPRNDIYLTLSRPSLPNNAFLSHPRTGTTPITPENGMVNLQLTLEVRNSNGSQIENCIFPSSNSSSHTAWRTVTVERSESWNQTVRLSLDPEDIPGSHIIMSVADVPNFPFALCWIPLWTSNAFVSDGDHALALYKYDEHTSSIASGKGAYLSLPWSTSKVKDETVTGPIAAVHVNTYLCSTVHSQDPNLQDLLRWRENRSKGLEKILKKLPFVPEIEIVKLLSEVFDALFDAMVEHAGKEDLEDDIFAALVTVLSIVHDRRFNLSPRVDEYADKRFNFPFAFPCLLGSFVRLLEDPTSPETARKLRSTCKVGAYVFKFMINARQQQVHKEVGIGINSHSPTFAKEFEGIFNLLEDLMRNEAPILVGTKTVVVQNFHAWIPQLPTVMSSDEILKVVTKFVDACSAAQGKLILYKLLLIRNLSAIDLFETEETKTTWQHHVQGWINPHWGDKATVNSQWRDQIRICCSVVSTLFSKYGSQGMWVRKLIESYKAAQTTPIPPKATFSPLFPTTYPFPTRQADSKQVFDEASIETSALIASCTSLPRTAFPDIPPDQLAGRLIDALNVCRSILSFDAFPSSWLSVHILHHKSVLMVLDTMFDILSEKFIPAPDDAGDFNDELWKCFLITLLKLAASDSLALETFPEQKRRAVWKIGGDIRENGAELLERSWDALGWENSEEDRERYGPARMGGYQVSYVPSLVSPMLELCFSVHEGLRSVAIGVLHTMIIGEWTLNESLHALQTQMIDDLDRLYKEKSHNDGMLQKLFLAELRKKIEPLSKGPEKELFDAVSGLLNTIEQLLNLLIAVYVPEASGDAFHILDTLRLLAYLKDMDKVDIYIGYVHKLAQLQLESNNPTEAGLALKMHADIHDWDTSKPLSNMVDPHFPTQSSFDRKEQIYFEMIKNFEEGLSWQQALSAYDELAYQYQHNVYDFAKLARAQRATANIYERIGKMERHNPRYFRVAYRGLGFPANLRDKQYIFEASSGERLSSFKDKLQRQYPSAHIVGSGHLDELEGQYLSVYAVSPQKDFYHPINRKIKAAQPIKDHFMLSNPGRFAHTTRRQGSGSGVKDQVQEKVVYTTIEKFPTILRRSEVTTTETVRMTPVQIGLERTSRKTQDVQALARTVEEDGETAFTALTETLMNLVNRNSTASVAGYCELVVDQLEEDDDDDEEEDETTRLTPREDPLEEALRIALLDHVLTIRRCLELYARSAHQATKAELSRDLTNSFAPMIKTINILFPKSTNTTAPSIEASSSTSPHRPTSSNLDNILQHSSSTSINANVNSNTTNKPTTTGAAELTPLSQTETPTTSGLRAPSRMSNHHPSPLSNSQNNIPTITRGDDLKSSDGHSLPPKTATSTTSQRQRLTTANSPDSRGGRSTNDIIPPTGNDGGETSQPNKHSASSSISRAAASGRRRPNQGSQDLSQPGLPAGSASASASASAASPAPAVPSTPTTTTSNSKLGAQAQGGGAAQGGGGGGQGLAARMGSMTKRLSGFGGSKFGSLRGANGDGGELGGRERDKGAGGGGGGGGGGGRDAVGGADVKGNRKKGSSRGLNRMGSLAEDG